MVRRGAVQADPEKVPQRQRVRRAPRDASLRVHAFEVPNQQEPEVDAGRQTRTPHRLRVELGALGFDEVIEAVLAEELIQSGIERVTGRGRQVSGRHPHGGLVTLACSHRHARHRSTVRGMS
jgi:hypothetical protein